MCVITYRMGLWLYRRKKYAILNPVVTASLVIIIVLKLFNIDIEIFRKGGNMILFFLGPVTVTLAVPLYREMHQLKKHVLPILVGIFTGAVTAISSVYLMSRLFGLSSLIMKSLLPKSVTMPIGMAISEQYGAIVPVTIISIIIAGVSGAVLAPFLCRIFGIKNSVARGIAIGTASHALGTVKALEMDRLSGAMSGLAIGVAGVITTFILAVCRGLF